MKATREDVYASIDSEIAYQKTGLGNSARPLGEPTVMSVAEAILYMEKCLSDARDAAYRGINGGQEALPFIRKVTALGVTCLEDHGAPLRDASRKSQ